MKHAYVPRTTSYSLNPEDELNDLRMSEQVRPLYDHVKKFIRDEVDPITEEFYRLGEKKTDRWSCTPGQLELLEKAKAKAKEGPVELLPPQRRDRRGAVEPRLRLHRRRARQEPARVGDA